MMGWKAAESQSENKCLSGLDMHIYTAIMVPYSGFAKETKYEYRNHHKRCRKTIKY